MSSKQGQGSAGIAIAVTAVIVIALTSIGYYQYVVVGTSTSTQTSTTQTGPHVQINTTVGAATKTDDAYSPNPVTLIIGVNNTFVVYNGDIQGGVGVPHSYTDKGGAFDSGVLQGGETSKQITITTPGTYNIYCVIHPTTMRGLLKVVQGTGRGTGSSSSATSTTSHSGNSSTTTTTSSGTNATSSGTSGAGISAEILPGTSNNLTSAGFSPSTIVVIIGVNNTVSWKNMDTAVHTVTAKDGSFDSGNLDPGKSFSHTFATAGTFEIKCKYHSWMHETVVVKAKS